MGSWVYLFSKFTPEALLFEALIFFILVASYAVFWILRKRKFGVVETEVPATVVKDYLNDLISQAHTLRVQLFGLLNNAGANPGSPPLSAGAPIDMAQLQAAIQAAMAGNNAPSAGAGATSATFQNLAATPSGGDANSALLAQKLAAMEAQLLSQTKAMESIQIEKQKLEKSLTEAKQNAGAGGSGGAAAGDDSELRKKIKELEGRLDEYSIIEDDLANLKRLQQENAQLKAALAAGAGAVAAGAPTPAPAISEPTPPLAAEAAPAEPLSEAPAPAEAASEAAAEDPSAAAQALADSLLAETPAPVEAAAPAPAPETPSEFEGLVDKIEASLEPAPPMAAEAAVAAEPAPPVSAAEAAVAPPPPAADQNDADLVAEFEKMLNG